MIISSSGKPCHGSTSGFLHPFKPIGFDPVNMCVLWYCTSGKLVNVFIEVQQNSLISFNANYTKF
jgi:hypothetical protein